MRTLVRGGRLWGKRGVEGADERGLYSIDRVTQCGGALFLQDFLARKIGGFTGFGLGQRIWIMSATALSDGACGGGGGLREGAGGIGGAGWGWVSMGLAEKR